MKKNGKNYEMMANGFLQSLKDYSWKTYSVIEFSHDDYYVNRADKAFLKRLGYTTIKSLSNELNLDFNDTGLDTILVHYPKDLDEKVAKLKEMRERWRDEHSKAHPYVPSNSNAHAYQLEASYDIMSDD